MKRILALTTASLMASAAFAGPALAGDDMKKDIEAGADTKIESGAEADAGMDTDTSAGADVTTDTGADAGTDAGTDLSSDTEAGADTEVDPGTTAATGTEADLDSAIAAIRGGSMGASAIESMTEVSNVNVVRVDSLAEGGDTAELDSAVSENQAEIDELRAAIESNSALSSELEAQQVEASNVVAAETQADGSLTVYTQ